MRATRGMAAGAFIAVFFASASLAQAGALVADRRPRVSVETALVAWNPWTGIEHLFVAARFDGIDGPFVWWLPVPSSPKAELVGHEFRTTFSSLIASYRARTPRWELPSLPNGEERSALVFGGLGEVEVVVHAIPSRKAADELLEAAGRRRDPALRDYLNRYAEQAFHIVELRADPGAERWTSPWIHLQFEAQRPWYPYREPAYRPDLHVVDDAARLLRVYVLSSERMALRHGESKPTMAYAWLAFEPRHDEVEQAFGPQLAGSLGFDPAQRLWLTSFEDRHVTRPGDDDLTFAPWGAVPQQGQPGTVGDKSGAGIRFDPVGAPRTRRHRDRAEPAAVESARVAPPPAQLPRRQGRQRVGLAEVFGIMVLFALGVAGWLARSDRRDATNRRQRT